MMHVAILISSAGRRVGLIECFRRSAIAAGLDLSVFACDVEPELSAGCHAADRSFAVPRCDEPAFVEAVLDIVREHDVHLVVPTIDTELAPLATAANRFAAAGARVHVSPPPVIEIVRDKLKTAEVLAGAGVPVPWTVSLDRFRSSSNRETDPTPCLAAFPDGKPVPTFPGNALDAVGKDADRLAWPLFLKPSGGSASRGIRVVTGPGELPAFPEEPMILQQLLDGPEYTVNMFIDQEGALRSAVAHRRLRIRAGEVEKGRTERDPKFRELAEGIVRALPDARGVLCFQVIVDRSAGPRVFEINARFGGGYPLAHRAGAEYTRWLLEEVTGLPGTAHDNWLSGVLMLRYDAAVFPGWTR